MFKTIIATVSAIIILNVLGGLGLGIIITAALIYIFKRGSQENPVDYMNSKPTTFIDDYYDPSCRSFGINFYNDD